MSPVQQSLFTVQPSPEFEHALIGGGGVPPVSPGAAHRPPTQVWLQQSVAAVAAVQLPPVSLHVGDEVGSRQAWYVPASPKAAQVSPEQQLVSLAPEQAEPNGLHDPPALSPPHRRTPTESGMHGSMLQHWSRNWQSCPGWMQHIGFVPSQPVGHAVDPPPKQRITLFASGLQTAFLPSQQSCDAFVLVLAPQMLPGGLHAPPLSHVCFKHWTAWAVDTSELTLQQASVESQ